MNVCIFIYMFIYIYIYIIPHVGINNSQKITTPKAHEPEVENF